MLYGSRDAQRFVKLFWVIWAVTAVLGITALIAVVLVAIHFIGKYW